MNATEGHIPGAYDGVYRSLGRQVAIARRDRGTPLAELARDVGESEDWIALCEQGSVEITLRQLCSLSEALAMPLTKLLPASSSDPVEGATATIEDRVARAQANHPDPEMAARARLLGDDY